MDSELTERMFKDYCREVHPQFSANDIAELVADIKFDWEEWQQEALVHDPSVGIVSKYR